MEAVIAEFLEVEIKQEIEEYVREGSVKVGPADCEENRQRNVGFFVNLPDAEDKSNVKKGCEELNSGPIKMEEVHVKTEGNLEHFAETLQSDSSKEKQTKNPKHRKCMSVLKTVNEKSDKKPKKRKAYFKNDLKVLLYRCKNCTYKCNSRKLIIKHRFECNSKCKTCNAELKGHRIGQCPTCFFGGFLPPKDSFYQCPHCPFASGVKCTYTRHLPRHQGFNKKDLMYCQECPFYCIYKTSLIHHTEKHRIKTEFPCRYCSYCATRAPYLTNHEKLHEPDHKIEVKVSKWSEKLLKCQQCPYACSTQRAFNKHKACHDARTGIKCQFCSFKTQHPVVFGAHRKLHTLEPFKCTKCSYKTWRASSIKAHCLTHEPKYVTHKFKCSKCRYRTSKKNRLQRHVQNQHNMFNRQELVYCYECPFSCSNKTTLIHHIESHRLKTGFQCKDCSYCAMNAAKLKSHEKLHETKHKVEVNASKSAEKLRKCKQCPYVCSTRETFKRHKACHDARTGIKCEFCSFKTEHAKSLGRHRKVHTLEPFKCTECFYETWKASTFKRHCLTHESKLLTLKFKCNECPYRTSRNDVLQRHFKNKHGNK